MAELIEKKMEDNNEGFGGIQGLPLKDVGTANKVRVIL